MDAFNELRRQARERREKAICEARDAYAATRARIAALEQDILGRDLSSHRTIASCIDSLLPTDRTFTTVDILAGLEALDPRRNWRKRPLDSHISRLRERGPMRQTELAMAILEAGYHLDNKHTPPSVSVALHKTILTYCAKTVYF